MSDDERRALERRFRASGSPQDEAAWLRARVQGGDLSERRLQLAAHLGSQAATELVQSLALPAPPPPHAGNGGPGWELINWAWCPWVVDDQEILVRVALAAARSVAQQEPAGAPLLAAAEAWLVCPCQSHEANAQAVWEESPRNLAASGAALAAAWINPVVPGDGIRMAVGRAARATSEQHVRDGVREDVVPWVLGYQDPVRLRAEGSRSD